LYCQYSETIEGEPVTITKPWRSSTVFCAASKASLKLFAERALIFMLLISLVTFSTSQVVAFNCPGVGATGHTITWPDVFLKKWRNNFKNSVKFNSELVHPKTKVIPLIGFW